MNHLYKFEIATPVSHLFRDEKIAHEISSHSDCLEGRDRTAKINFGFQKLFHSDLQPIHKWTQVEFDYFQSIAETKKNIEYLTFHIASCCNSPTIVDRKFVLGGEVYSKEEMRANAKINFAWLRSIFPKNTLFGIENNNYYPTSAYDHVTDISFLNDLSRDNNLFFLFDLSHAKVTAFNLDISIEKYLENFPFEKVLQIHISHAGGPYPDGLYYDDHAEITDQDLMEIQKYIKKCPSLRFLTVEYYQDSNKLINTLIKLRGLIEKLVE
jgi:sugar phosphate isomerase/epimerase